MFLNYLDDDKINDSADMVSIYDTGLLIKKWNPACERQFGIPAEVAINKTLEEIFPHYQIQNDYRYTCLRDSVREGKSFYFPGLPYRYRNGLYYQTIVPLKCREGKIVGTLNVIRDHALAIGKISKRDLLVPLIRTSSPRLASL
jgi:PAS domain-containing protein